MNLIHIFYFIFVNIYYSTYIDKRFQYNELCGMQYKFHCYLNFTISYEKTRVRIMCAGYIFILYHRCRCRNECPEIWNIKIKEKRRNLFTFEEQMYSKKNCMMQHCSEL